MFDLYPTIFRTKTVAMIPRPAKKAHRQIILSCRLTLSKSITTFWPRAAWLLPSKFLEVLFCIGEELFIKFVWRSLESPRSCINSKPAVLSAWPWAWVILGLFVAFEGCIHSSLLLNLQHWLLAWSIHRFYWCFAFLGLRKISWELKISLFLQETCHF